MSRTSLLCALLLFTGCGDDPECPGPDAPDLLMTARSSAGLALQGPGVIAVVGVDNRPQVPVRCDAALYAGTSNDLYRCTCSDVCQLEGWGDLKPLVFQVTFSAPGHAQETAAVSVTDQGCEARREVELSLRAAE